MKLEQYFLSIIKNHYHAVVICFVLLGIGCISTTEFSVDHSIESWLDKDTDNYRQYRRMIAEFGDDATLFVAYDLADLTSDKLGKYQSFIEHTKATKGVSVVYDPVNMFLINLEGDGLDDAAIEDLKILFSQESADFRNVLMSSDMKTLGILVILNQDLEYLHPQIINDVKQGLANIGLNGHFAGTSYFSDTLSRTLTHDLTVIITVLIVTTMLIILWFLRSPVVLVCVIMGVSISLIYTLALSSILGIKFNLLTLILYPLIFCIGITTSIHLFSRREKGLWDLESAYKKIFKPATITSITTVIGCSAFIFAPQAVVREMGLVFPAAISITYLVMMTFVPSVYLMLANKRGLPCLPVTTTSVRFDRKNFIVSIFLFIATILAAYQLPGIRTEADAIFFFSPDSELIRSYRYIENRLSGLLLVDMIVETTDETDITSKQNIEQISEFADSVRKLPGLTSIISPLDWLNIHAENAIAPELNRAYLSKNNTSMRLTFHFRNVSDIPYAAYLNNLKKGWNEHKHPGLAMHITGLLPLILEAQDALLTTQAMVFPVILILMTLVLLLIIPSWKVLLSAGLVNLLPLVIMLGVMVTLEIPINSINLFVVSVMLGVIVDDTIHLLHAWDKTGSIDDALTEVKPALLITTLTIVMAFSSLLLSSLKPVAQFGLLSAIAVIVAYLCDVYLLPCLLDRRPVSI